MINSEDNIYWIEMNNPDNITQSTSKSYDLDINGVSMCANIQAWWEFPVNSCLTDMYIQLFDDTLTHILISKSYRSQLRLLTTNNIMRYLQATRQETHL